MAVHPRYRDSFAEHASIEAIDHEIKTTRKAIRAQERFAEWLDDLRQTRADQIAAGTWLPKPETEA